MDLSHSFTVPSSVDEAWALFMDLEAVGNCFPGATVTDVTGDSFAGTVKVKLGPIALVYAGSGSFVDRDDAAHRAVIEAKGKDKRGNGTAGATVTIELRPDGTGTRADVVTDLSVTGKPAQFGRGVMQDVSDKLLQAFVACVEQQLTAKPDAARATARATAPAVAPGPPVPEATVQDAAEAATHPEIVTEAVPHEVTDPSGKVTLEEAVERGHARAAGAATANGRTGARRDASASADDPGAAAAAARSQPPPGDTSDTHTAGTSATSSAAYGSHGTRVSESEEVDALDLGATLMPVLLRRYAGYAAVGVVGVIAGWLLARRMSR